MKQTNKMKLIKRVSKSSDGKHEPELTDDVVAVFEQMLDETDDTDVMKKNRQSSIIYVNSYDVHGKYFEQLIAIFRKFGLIVKKTYNINDTKLFMKENENDDGFVFFRDDLLNESDEDPSETEEMKFVKAAATGLGKDFKFIDDDHWYIRID